MPIHVRSSGNVNGETILFLHGGMVAGWMWEYQVATLDQFHCLVVDLPGIGNSADVAWRSLDETAVELTNIITQHANGGKAHLVGLSLGAVVALRVMKHAPDLVNRVVLSGTLTRPVGSSIVTLQKLMLWFYHHHRLAWVVARVLQIPRDGDSSFLETAHQTPKETYTVMLDELYRQPLPTDLVGLPMPILTVTGMRDAAIAKHGISDLVELFPNAQGYLVPNVGHQWNAEDPALFSEMVSCWLQDTPLPDVLVSVENPAKANKPLEQVKTL